MASQSSDSDKEKIRQLIYTPSQSARAAVTSIEAMAKNRGRGVPLGIPVIDDTFAPVMPGQICAVIAQTSHYKSGLLHYIEHNLASRIILSERPDDIVIHISVEEGVEEQEYLEVARITGIPASDIMTADPDIDMDLVSRGITQRTALPIYRIGDSQERRDANTALHITNMRAALDILLDEMFDWTPNIAAIFVDFLQRIPLDPEFIKYRGTVDRRLQVMDDVMRLRKMAQFYDTPIFVAVQAKQELKNAKGQIFMPGIYDGEETSSIAQYFDRVLTVWMPGRTNELGEMITVGNKQFVVRENSMWIKIAKQRGGLVGNRMYPCVIDFTRNMIEIDPDYYRIGPRR